MVKAQVFCMIMAAGLLGACGGGSSSSGGGGATSLKSTFPGSELPLGETVIARDSGDYVLPANAASITTRCIGSVTIVIPNGSSESNDCSSPDGSANMTNSVSGASKVIYSISPGGSAHITIK